MLLHFAFGVELALAAMLAFTASFAFPDLAAFQSRRHLGLIESGSLGVLVALCVLAFGSVIKAVDDSRALRTVASAEQLERHGLDREAFDKLNPVAARLTAVPRVHVALACAAFDLGRPDYATVQLQTAFFFGDDSTRAPSLPDCFLNRDLHKRWVFLSDPFGTLLVAPASDPQHWRPTVERLLRTGHYADALIALGCAHDSVGARDTAALFVTLVDARVSHSDVF